MEGRHGPDGALSSEAPGQAAARHGEPGDPLSSPLRRARHRS